MSDKKQMMDIKAVKNVAAAVSDEHQRNWSNGLFERKAGNPDHNYDRSRTALNFQVGRGGVISAVDKSRSIGEKIDDIIKVKLNANARVTKISNRGVCIVFGGNRERMREIAFGAQQLNEHSEDNSHLIRQPEIERWAKDVYGFVCREFGEDNIASFIVHLDELNPHAHCVFVPMTPDGRLCTKEVIGGKNKSDAQRRMRELHTRFAEVSRKYGLDRGDDIRETGARHRSTDEYNRELHRENTMLESLIGDNREQLRQLRRQVKKAEKRVKGLSTMIANLESRHFDLSSKIASMNDEIMSGSGNAAELRCRIAELEKRLMDTETQLTDKRDKLRTANEQLQSLHDEESDLKNRTDHLRAECKEAAMDMQENIRLRLTDSVFGAFALAVKECLPYMPEEEKEKWPLVTGIAECPKEILKCAMYLFAGYIDGAIQFAQSCGGGCSGSDLPWGRDKDEDDRHFAYRCMSRAAKLIMPVQKKHSIGRR